MNLFAANREQLEKTEHPVGYIWRSLTLGPLSTPEIDEIVRKDCPTPMTYAGVRGQLRRLQEAGWVEEAGFRRRGRQVVVTFVARAERDTSLERPVKNKENHRVHGRIERARKRLTELSSIAHKARYSTVGAEMGAALAELEEEIRKVRDSLTTKRWLRKPSEHGVTGEAE